MTLPEYGWLASVPDSLFLPHPWLMTWFTGMPDAAVLEAMTLAARACAFALGFGLWTRPAAPLLGVLLILLDGFAYSTEKVHHHLIVAFVPLALAFSPWNSHYSLRRTAGATSTDDGWPLAILALAVGFVFLGATLPKLLGGWLDISTRAALTHVLSRGVAHQNVGALLGFAIDHRDSPAWELVDWMTVLVESAALLAVIRLRAFRAALAALTLLHTSIWLFMGPRFSDYIIVYAAFVDWPKVVAFLRQLPSGLAVMLAPLPCTLLYVLPLAPTLDEAVLVLSSVGALAYGGGLLFATARRVLSRERG